MRPYPNSLDYLSLLRRPEAFCVLKIVVFLSTNYFRLSQLQTFLILLTLKVTWLLKWLPERLKNVLLGI